MEEFAAFLWAFFVFWLDKITNLKMWIWALGNCVNNRHGFVFFFSSVISCFILGLYPLVFCCHFLPPAHLCYCVLSPSCVPCAPSQSDFPPTHTHLSHISLVSTALFTVSLHRHLFTSLFVGSSVLRPCVSSASPHVFLVFLICSLWFFLFGFFGFFWFAISCVFVFSFFLGLSFAWLLLLAFWISHWTSDSLLLVFNSLVSVFLCLGLLYI